MTPDGVHRPASLSTRTWAFIIDQAIVGVFVAAAWAPLALTHGDPIRFEPLWGFPDTECELVEEFHVREPDGDETRGAEHACVSTYFGRWESHERVRTEVIVKSGTSFSQSARWPTDPAGRPIAVVNDGLMTALVLLVYFTLCEGSGWGGTTGKFLLGLKVVAEDGGRVRRSAAFGRNLAKLLPIIAMYGAGFWNAPLAALLDTSVSAATGIGGLMAGVLLFGGVALALITRERRTFHDFVSNTVVRATA